MPWQDVRNYYRARPGRWFRPKLFGWGVVPVTWQGWAMTLAFVVLLGLLVTAFEPAFALLFALPLLTSFMLVAWRKTDGDWRWRWGLPD